LGTTGDGGLRLLLLLIGLALAAYITPEPRRRPRRG
jgi:hypothetical protein